MNFNELMEILKEHFDKDITKINYETKLKEIGLDSIDALELASIIEEKINKEIEITSFEKFGTIKDILDEVNNL